MNVKNKTWDIVIKPSKKLFDFKLKELWSYRDLVVLFVKRDFVAYYKQTILGPIWFFLQPLFTTAIYMLVFGRIVKVSTDGVPNYLFFIAGILNWNYFAECLNKTANTFTSNSSIFGKVYFPRLTVPLSIVLSNLVTYLIQFLLLIVFIIIASIYQQFHFQFGLQLLLMPLLVLQIALFGLGMGIIVSSLTTKYKDLSFAVVFGVQLAMYATPVVYPMSTIPAKWSWLFYYNPMASIIETFRTIIFQINNINWGQYLTGWLITILVLFIGVALFTKVEKSFMDTI